MTAEIAILNRSAIALAADSAVTVRSPFGRKSDPPKVYNTANKLFTMSKYWPVGLMVYGNAEFMGYPWDTVVKIYRSELGRTSFDTIRGHCDHFIKFLSSHAAFSAESEKNYVSGSIGGYFSLIVREIDAEVKKRFEVAKPVTQQDVAATVDSVVPEHVATWAKREYLSGLDESTGLKIQEAHAIFAEDLRAKTFQRLPLSEVAKAGLRSLVGALFTKDHFQSDASGVVVAGFGTSDFYPSLAVYEIEGVTCGFLKYARRDAETVGGPVDVALITKGDGFIWIRRKYYFDLKYNQHFLRNYYQRLAATWEEPHGSADNSKL